MQDTFDVHTKAEPYRGWYSWRGKLSDHDRRKTLEMRYSGTVLTQANVFLRDSESWALFYFSFLGVDLILVSHV